MKRSRAQRFALSLAFSSSLLGPARALADAAEVVLIRPRDPGPLLTEALIRLQAELRAVGLEVIEQERDLAGPPPTLEGLEYGSIVLVRRGPVIEIYAYAKGLESPVIQLADTSASGIDPEVVAIRAVEALRAAMVQFARREQARRAPLPESVSGFTRLSPTPRALEPAQGEQPQAPADRPRTGLELGLFLGPSATWDLPIDEWSFGGQVSAFAGSSWYRLGLYADRVVLQARVDDASGTVWSRRTVIAGEMRARLAAGLRSVVFVGLGAGALHHDFEAVANAGYVSHGGQHTSLVISADSGAAYFFIDDFGLYLSVRCDVATDAPRLRLASREGDAFARPALSSSVGVVVGQF